MNWGTTSDFFAMGGYAFYVWGSFGACAIAMVLETVSVSRRLRTIRQRLHRQLLADQQDKDEK